MQDFFIVCARPLVAVGRNDNVQECRLLGRRDFMQIASLRIDFNDGRVDVIAMVGCNVCPAQVLVGVVSGNGGDGGSGGGSSGG